jgi:hypothetical protein
MADSTLDGCGSAIVPASTTLIAGRTAGGTSGRCTVRQLLDAAPIYGHMYYDNAVGTLLQASAGFTAFTAGAISGMTYVNDATADYLRVDTAGTYLITWSGSFALPAATSWTMGLYVNGVACARGCTAREAAPAGGATTDGLSMHTITPTLAALDQLSWRWVRTGAGDITCYVLSMSALRVGP